MEPLQIIVAGAQGRMGQMLVNLVLQSSQFALAGALEREDKLSELSLSCLVSDNLANLIAATPKAVVVDFTAPEPTLEHAEICEKNQTCLVAGTTGFTEGEKEQLQNFAKKTRIFWSANMSVGVNALLSLLPVLATALGPDYDMEIMEIHHKHKKDAPSGTALLLGDALAKSRNWNLEETRNSKRDGLTGERPEKEIGIQALRGGDVVGIHSTYFLGPGEIIQITHQAESRENFAMGALRAALWLTSQKPGRLFTMQDMIGLRNNPN